jgi:hypothetical protein
MPSSYLVTGNTFANGNQVTTASLNKALNEATFGVDSVDPSTMQLLGGSISIKDGGVLTAKIADSAVTTAKVVDAAITSAKLSAGAPSWTSTALNVASSLDFSLISPTALTGSYTRSGYVVTVSMTGHGMATGNIAVLTFSTESGTGFKATDGSYLVTVTGVDSFTITDTATGTISSTSASRAGYYGNATIRGSETINGSLTVGKSISAASGTLQITSPLSVTGDFSASSYTFGTAPFPIPSGTAPIYGARAYVRFNGATVSQTAISSAVRTSPSTTITITSTSHGFVAGNLVWLNFAATGFNGLYEVASVIGVDSFTVIGSGTSTFSTTGTIDRFAVTSNKNINSVIPVNENIAIPPTASVTRTTGTYCVNYTVAIPSSTSVFIGGSSSVTSGPTSLTSANMASGAMSILHKSTTATYLVTMQAGAAVTKSDYFINYFAVFA